MAAIHNLRRRIRSVRNTRQITRAMKLVSAAKMKRAQDQVYQARPFANKLREVIQHVSARVEIGNHPLLRHAPEQRIKFVVVSGDRGLCGSFNANVFRRVTELVAEHRDKELFFDFIGRKGAEFFEKKLDNVERRRTDVFRKFNPDVAGEVANELMSDFTGGKVDAVYVIYNEFKSVLQQNLLVERLLPLVGEDFTPVDEDAVPHLFEPNEADVLDELLPLYVESQVYRVLIESYAAEFAARMTAMDAATNNATEMIDKLTLEMNKIRQAAITKEIIEVVSGADAN